jgi:cold shock CspA family protein
MMTGQIRNIRDDKDFCFIVMGVNRDIFLHKSQFRGNWDELRELWRKGSVELEFEIEESPKGLRAIQARLKD